MKAEFRPELLSRRGEFFAWLSALMATGAWIGFSLTGVETHLAFKLLAVILVLCAAAISLGNWIDRRTRLGIDAAGISYENGLRKVHMPWEQIREVQVFRSNWGSKVRVVSENSYFTFRTLGEVVLRGEIKGRLGFAEGEKILAQILEESNLRLVQQPGSGYYYARE